MLLFSTFCWATAATHNKVTIAIATHNFLIPELPPRFIPYCDVRDHNIDGFDEPGTGVAVAQKKRVVVDSRFSYYCRPCIHGAHSSSASLHIVLRHPFHVPLRHVFLSNSIDTKYFLLCDCDASTRFIESIYVMIPHIAIR